MSNRKKLSALLLLCGAGFALLTLLPGVRNGLFLLINRVFAASEAVNRYAYQYLPVTGEAGITAACILLGLCALCLLGWALVSGSDAPAVLLFAVVCAAQAWIGLTLPPAVLLPAAVLLAGSIAARHAGIRGAAVFTAAALLLAVVCTQALPSGIPAVEAASEQVRDLLDGAAASDASAGGEEAEGERHTRHENRRTLTAGDEDTAPDGEYRLVTVQEQQISLPERADWLRILLLVLLIPVVLAVPFAPFVWITRRARITAERLSFLDSGEPDDAVRGVLPVVNGYFDACGVGARNALYAERPAGCAKLPGAYTDLYAACAEDWQRLVYGGFPADRIQAERAVRLLQETERLFYDTAGARLRFRLRYIDCLHE